MLESFDSRNIIVIVTVTFRECIPHYRITTEKVVLNVTGKVVVPTIAGLWRGCAVPDQWYLLMNQTGLNFEKPAGKVSERK